MTDVSPEQLIADLLPQLCSARLTFFPIRHHSPACAAQVQNWIDEHRPASVLVEGPQSFTPLIDLVLDDECVCPVAFYTSFIDKRRLLRDPADQTLEAIKQREPDRFAAFYPFCDYSPELVALRIGRQVGARLRFIDLDYAAQLLAGREALSKSEGVRIESLADDSHLKHSQYVQALARQLGCRDFNELWDHLFETQWLSLDTPSFVRQLATYCAMARLDYSAETLHRDGAIAREACMADAIRDEIVRNEAEGRDGPVLVVTGGFHTAALPALVRGAGFQPARPLKSGQVENLPHDEVGHWLIRYSFDQLDSLSGYGAGMPSPAYYERLWRAVDSERIASEVTNSFHDVAADILVEIGRLTRDRNLPTAISTPDAIAALQMAQRLAELRGHPWPLREDVLDGVRSCFIKGEVGTEGLALLAMVREVLAGDRVGRVPHAAGVPPIVSDFQRETDRLRIKIDNVERREMTLDLYRKETHREISRLFHRLDLLRVPFASFLSGPDFVSGHGLDLMQEHWQVAWTPATESGLITAAVFGTTIVEAAAAKLREEIARLADEGQGRSTLAAVTTLVRACRLGLHQFSDELSRLIDEHISEDPSLPSVVGGLAQLDLLSRSREPLEAAHLTALPRLMTAAFHRACRLIDDIATCPDEAAEEIVKVLRTLREIVLADVDASATQADLFHAALARVIALPPDKSQAAVVGAALGILFVDGQCDENQLLTVAMGFLSGTQEPRKSCGILRGLLATAREIAWQLTEFLEAVDAQFASWDEDAFLASLPELRLAFSDLTPRETSQVADQVAKLHGETTLGELVQTDLDESDVRLALEITRRVRESLTEDGLRARITETT